MNLVSNFSHSADRELSQFAAGRWPRSVEQFAIGRSIPCAADGDRPRAVTDRELSQFAAGRWPRSVEQFAVGRAIPCAADGDRPRSVTECEPSQFEASSANPNRGFSRCSLNGLPVLLLFLSFLNPLNAETILLTGATVHTVSGPTLTPGQVLIKNGKIEVVDKAIRAAADKTVQLDGQHLYPGLIAVSTSLGLIEINAVRATRDSTEVGDYTPDVESWVAVNPDSELIPVARANGITHFLPVPTGGIVAGQSGLLAADGWTVEEMTIRKPVALHLFWPAMELNTTPKAEFTDKSKWKSLADQAKERREKIRALEGFFDEARAYAKARAAGDKNGLPKENAVPAWDAMLPFVRAELPVMVHADDQRQIRAAVQWAATNSYRIILAGGRDAWRVPSLLATNKIPVVFERIYNQADDLSATPARDTDPYDVYFRAPQVLHQAGVKVIFSVGLGGEPASETRNLPYSAAQAVAFGLPEDEALRGITLYPAEILGVADRLGSIEAGKEATLFSSDGDILDIRANVKRMWIAGRDVSLESRHTRLYEKYKARPRAK